LDIFHLHTQNASVSDDFRGVDAAGQREYVLDEAMSMPSFLVSCLDRDRIKTCVVGTPRHYELHTVHFGYFHRPMEGKETKKSMEQ
jgi:hypothetical protein